MPVTFFGHSISRKPDKKLILPTYSERVPSRYGTGVESASSDTPLGPFRLDELATLNSQTAAGAPVNENVSIARTGHSKGKKAVKQKKFSVKHKVFLLLAAIICSIICLALFSRKMAWGLTISQVLLIPPCSIGLIVGSSLLSSHRWEGGYLSCLSLFGLCVCVRISIPFFWRLSDYAFLLLIGIGIVLNIVALGFSDDNASKVVYSTRKRVLLIVVSFALCFSSVSASVYLNGIEKAFVEARSNSRSITLQHADKKPTYYIGNSSTKVFHKPNCTAVEQMLESHKVRLSSRSAAISAGYKPCGNCYP